MRIQRTIATSPETVLNEIENHCRAKFPKVNLQRENSEVTLTKKVLWQKQEAKFTIEGSQIIAEGQAIDSQKWIYHTLGAIDSLLDDHGWTEAAEKHGTTSTKSSISSRNRVIEELAQDEVVEIAVSGLSLKKRTVLTVTNKRVILVNDSPMGTKTSAQSIPLDKISSVKSGSGMLTGSIEVVTSNETIKLNDVIKREAESLARVLSQ